MTANIEKIQARQALVEEMMQAAPQGMVSKPHICWATDQLSHAERDITALLSDLEQESEQNLRLVHGLQDRMNTYRKRAEMKDKLIRKYLQDPDEKWLMDALDNSEFEFQKDETLNTKRPYCPICHSELKRVSTIRNETIIQYLYQCMNFACDNNHSYNEEGVDIGIPLDRQ